MELTKEYFDEQLKNLATKDDLKNLATKDELDNLKTFVQSNLVTKKEFEDRLAELPTKRDFNGLLRAVDGLAKQLTGLTDELSVGASRSKRMEDWIIKAAEKIGVEYER
jgi:hypothetical protein